MPDPIASLRATAGAPARPLDAVRPLQRFYADSGQVLPPWEIVDGQAIPQPIRSLLVHTDDMTPTLEAFYGQSIHIHALRLAQSEKSYSRLVVLHLDALEQPVEFGANHINLSLFPEEARRLILEEHIPLGRILSTFDIVHTCEPDAFLRVATDPIINEALQLRGAHVLYGRHNRLYNPHRQLLSEVVEILATPAAPTRTPTSLP